jgi:hypothetical protein
MRVQPPQLPTNAGLTPTDASDTDLIQGRLDTAESAASQMQTAFNQLRDTVDQLSLRMTAHGNRDVFKLFNRQLFPLVNGGPTIHVTSGSTVDTLIPNVGVHQDIVHSFYKLSAYCRTKITGNVYPPVMLYEAAPPSGVIGVMLLSQYAEGPPKTKTMIIRTMNNTTDDVDVYVKLYAELGLT